MSNQVQMKVEELKSLRPLQIVENKSVESKFVQMYNAIWGDNLGEQRYNREKFHFNKLLSEKPDLQQCSNLSLFGCFLDIAVNGLSLDQSGKPQVYIIPSNCKVKLPDGREIWEKRAALSVTAYGEVFMRQRAGQIRYCDNPVIVYECDEFSVSADENGNKKVHYVAKFPRTSNKPIAAFIRITRADGSQDIQWMGESDWQRLAQFSSKKNKGKTNELYTSNNGSIDIGFLENKMIKHAFDAYPKVRVGNFTQLQTEQEEPLDYGFDMPEEVHEEQDAAPFGEDRQLEDPTPVKVEVSSEDEESGF